MGFENKCEWCPDDNCRRTGGNEMNEPTVSQILMCGNFSKRTTKKIIEAHTKALYLLNKQEVSLND